MIIRVTPIGGEPVELPEETECIGHHDRHGDVIEVLDVDNGEDGDTTARVRFPKSGQVEFRLVSTLTRATLSRPYFVHVGAAWPLCEIETWRARAERLERELEAMRAASMPAYRYCEACQDIPGGCSQCCPNEPL